MDSLSQIVLGAAVGEALLGKKAGSKAVLWGAVLGTTPDLDVIPGNILIRDSIEQLLFHRGFSHSIFFSVLAAPIFAWLIKKQPKISLSLFLTAVYGTLMIGIPSITFRIICTVIFALFGWLTYSMKPVPEKTTYKDWALLSFLCLITHPVLDGFTSYGTQLFWPFKERVAWNTIFVADPLYTVPFMIFVLLALIFKRTSRTRYILNGIGIAVSCLYLVFTIINKQYINSIFISNLKEQNIEYTEFITKPMPLNNLLWSITVKGKENMYLGYFSWLDDDQKVKFLTLKKNHPLGNEINNQKKFKRLTFFSDNYYVMKQKPDTLFYGDLKFGVMDGYENPPKKFIMSYDIINIDGDSKFIQNFRKDDPEDGDFKRLVDRVMGKKFNSLY